MAANEEARPLSFGRGRGTNAGRTRRIASRRRSRRGGVPSRGGLALLLARVRECLRSEALIVGFGPSAINGLTLSVIFDLNGVFSTLSAYASYAFSGERALEQSHRAKLGPDSACSRSDLNLRP
jgi:hypothetical protein